MKVEVPYFKQDTDYSCGAASIQMILGFFHIKESEEDLIRDLETKKRTGTSHDSIIEVLKENGLFCYVNNNSDLDEIKYYLEQKLPILIHYIEPVEDIGHYAIVTNITDQNVILNDPYYGKDFRIEIDEFLKRWVDEERNHYKWLLVASDEKFNLGRQYIPPEI